MTQSTILFISETTECHRHDEDIVIRRGKTHANHGKVCRKVVLVLKFKDTIPREGVIHDSTGRNQTWFQPTIITDEI